MGNFGRSLGNVITSKIAANRLRGESRKQRTKRGEAQKKKKDERKVDEDMTKPQPNKTNEVEKEREGEKERGMFWWPWSRIWREGQGKEGKGREGPEYSTAQWYV